MQLIKSGLIQLRNNLDFAAAILGVLLLSLGWRAFSLNRFSFGYDEGIHLVVGRLWVAGFAPYREIFVSYPPIFLWSLGLPWQFFQRAEAMQWLMVAYSLAGVLAVIYLGTVYHSRLAGLSAGLLLSLTPTYFTRSFQVMTEVPSIAVAVVAIAFTEKFRRDGGRGWLLAAGSTLGFALSLKILPVYAIPLTGLMVLSRQFPLTINRAAFGAALRQHGLTRLIDAVWLGGSFTLVFLGPVLLIDLGGFLNQTADMRLASREIVSLEAQFYVFRANNEVIIDFIFANPLVAAPALLGLVFVVAPNLRRYGWLLVWLVLIWVTMYSHIPLRAKHLPIFLPVLVLWAGFGLQYSIDFWQQPGNRRLSLRTGGLAAAMMLCGLMMLWDGPRVIHENQGQANAQAIDEDYQAALSLVQHISRPGDCVISDDPVFLHRADRLPAPELAEASQTRIETGFLTLADIQTVIAARQCPVVAAVTNRFNRAIPGLPAWLAETYAGYYKDGDYVIYFGLRQAAINPQQSFAPYFDLVEAQIPTTGWRPGGGTHLTLDTTLQQAWPPDYRQHLHLLNGNDVVVQHIERLPFEGRVLPPQWQAGLRAADTFWFPLPDTLPPGSYRLYLSACHQDDQACAAFAASNGLRLQLAEVRVTP